MKQIGNYTVDETPIGSGGMGKVYRGLSPDGSTLVAVKEILPIFVTNFEYRKRIENEIRFLQKLNNRHVVKISDHFELEGNLYIVMELIDGLDIEQYVLRHGRLAWREAVNYMIQLLETMQYVHENYVVHRDIKPSNIMIRRNGEICLLDFGVAKDMTNQNGTNTVFGTVIGTDGYMSPEQASGMTIDHRSDIYALGCVLYYMITGQHAFINRGNALQMQKEITKGNFPRLADHVPELPSSLQKILDCAVEKNMMKRYQSCREFANELQRISNSGNTQAQTTANALKLTVGRAQDCDICIRDDDYKVSRYHLDIELKRFTGGEFYIIKDKSSNGTTINGENYTAGMSFTVPVGKNVEIYLAGLPYYRLFMEDIDRLFEVKKKALEQKEDRNETGCEPKDKISTPTSTPFGVPDPKPSLTNKLTVFFKNLFS